MGLHVGLVVCEAAGLKAATVSALQRLGKEREREVVAVISHTAVTAYLVWRLLPMKYCTHEQYPPILYGNHVAGKITWVDSVV